MLALAAVSSAQSPFDGTWKVDLNSTRLPEIPNVIVLQNGTFVCSSCNPDVNIKADGTDQSLQGNNAFDTMAIRILNDTSFERTNKKNEKIVSVAKNIVSKDGRTRTVDFTQYPAASKEPVIGRNMFIRVAAGPAGSHALSGSWRTQKVAVSKNAITGH